MFSSSFPSVRAQVLFLATLFCLLLPTSLRAIDLAGDKVQLHGFFTQGYMKSLKNNFLGDTMDGTFRLTETGININAQLTDQFRVGGQALYYNLPTVSTGKVRADWLVADYHFSDPFGVRLGKVKMPMGLYNMERDSDFLRPLIFLPQSIYDETLRDSWQSLWGGDMYGNLLLSKWGDIDYQLFGGRIQYEDDSLATLVTTEFVDHYNQQYSLFLTTKDMDRQNNYAYGAALLFNSSLKGLRGSMTLLVLDDDTWLHEYLVSSLRIKSKLVASLEYSWKKLSFTTEYCETDRSQEQFHVTTLNTPSQAWYMLLSYSPIEALTLSLLYDEYFRLKNNHYESTPQNHYPWRKDLAVSLRYDITENWTCKAELHTIDGTALYSGYFNPQGAERYWQYGALKLSFNF